MIQLASEMMLSISACHNLKRSLKQWNKTIPSNKKQRTSRPAPKKQTFGLTSRYSKEAMNWLVYCEFHVGKEDQLVFLFLFLLLHLLSVFSHFVQSSSPVLDLFPTSFSWFLYKKTNLRRKQWKIEEKIPHTGPEKFCLFPSSSSMLFNFIYYDFKC